MKAFPSATIVIVNFNGAHFLPACLDALMRQTYPRECFDVVVSDNGSIDGSLELIGNQYPWVKVIQNGKNLGFASGNNAAICSTQSDFYVLLNNDTAPHEDWLENLVKVADDNPKAGVVTSHIHLFYDYIEVQLISNVFQQKDDERCLGLRVYGIDSGAEKGVYQYLDGFWGWEKDAAGKKFRWTNGKACIGLPIPNDDGEISVRLQLASPRPHTEIVHCSLGISGKVLESWELQGDAISEITLTVPGIVRKQAAAAEQNTGSIIFRDGMCRDRGTYVKNNEAIFEYDHGQYAALEQVFAGCGAGMLLRKEMLEDVGLFDEKYFMYYEDIDLSWRARLRGWDVFYAPEAIIRHIHCGTMSEWSPKFLQLTESNRLATVFKNGSFQQVVRVWGGFFLYYLKCVGKMIHSALMHHSDWRAWASQCLNRTYVLVRLMIWKPRLWWMRFRIQRKRIASYREIEAWFQE